MRARHQTKRPTDSLSGGQRTPGVLGPGPRGKENISQACRCGNVIEQCFTELWEHVGGLRC